jgi:co-chaperonin GroES (HSP10)
MYPVPMPGRLLIEEFEEKTVTATGIYLTSDPDASIYQGHGVIKQVGSPDSEFNTGDEVYYNNNSGSLVKLSGKEYLVIKEDSVLVKMVKESNWYGTPQDQLKRSRRQRGLGRRPRRMEADPVVVPTFQHTLDRGAWSRVPARGIDHGLSVLDEAEVVEIYKSSLSLRKLAKKFNISHSTVSAIKHKKVWTQVTDEVDKEKTCHTSSRLDKRT